MLVVLWLCGWVGLACVSLTFWLVCLWTFEVHSFLYKRRSQVFGWRHGQCDSLNPMHAYGGGQVAGFMYSSVLTHSGSVPTQFLARLFLQGPTSCISIVYQAIVDSETGTWKSSMVCRACRTFWISAVGFFPCQLDLSH